MRNDRSLKSRCLTVGAGLVASVAAALPGSSPVRAAVVCGYTEVLDNSGLPILPFGGEYIGIGPEAGQIVSASYEVVFTTAGDFDAANLSAYLYEPVNGTFFALGFAGYALGWSGQGTFRASLTTDALNGYLESFGNPYTTFFITMNNLDLGAGPIQGTFEKLIFRVEYAPCPTGDVNHDASVNIDDLFMVINGWGACPTPPEPCPADADGSGSVDVDDLFLVINNWGDFCAYCK